MSNEHLEGFVEGETGAFYAKDINHPFLDAYAISRARHVAALTQLGIEEPEARFDELVQHIDRDVMRRILGEQRVNVENAQKLFDIRQYEQLRTPRVKFQETVRAADPTARMLMDELLPAISTISTADVPSAELKHFIRSLILRHPLWAASLMLHQRELGELIDDAKKEYPKSFEAVSLTLSRYLNNYLVQKTGYSFFISEAEGLVERELTTFRTIALAKIEQHGSYVVPDIAGDDNELEYFVLRPLRPVGMYSVTLGHWDLDASAANVFADTATFMAEHYQDIATHDYSFLEQPIRDFAQWTYSRYGGSTEKMAQIMQQGALCEEVKHGINGLRRMDFKSSESREHTFQEMRRRYEHLRLREHARLRTFFPEILAKNDHAAEESSGPDLQSLEECNAKLAELMVGPDPCFSLGSALGLTQKENENVRAYVQPLLVLLASYAYELPAAFVKENYTVLAQGILHTTTKNALRLLAQRILHEEYTEDMLKTPFCTLDAQGNLIRHSGTLDDFAEWM